MILEKYNVCQECLSWDIIYSDCICMSSNKFPTIELEFERCECCGNLSEKASNNDFNTKQYELIYGNNN